MIRSELIAKLAVATEISVEKAELAIKEVFDSMSEALAAGDGIEIRGFGSFRVRQYHGHEGRNPKSGEKIIVGKKKAPFFKTGKELKERIAGSVVVQQKE